jgi:hypothetical protein
LLEVGLDYERPPVQRSKRSGCFLGFAARRTVNHRHVRALARKRGGDDGPDPAAACDQCGSLGEIHDASRHILPCGGLRIIFLFAFSDAVARKRFRRA